MSSAERAKQVYEDELRARLESEHPDEFVAIEPDSRSYFLGKTFVQAAMAAKQAHPAKTSFVIRVGQDAAIHLGAAAT